MWDWNEIWGLLRLFEFSVFSVMIKKQVCDDLSFVSQCVILLEAVWS